MRKFRLNGLDDNYIFDGENEGAVTLQFIKAAYGFDTLKEYEFYVHRELMNKIKDMPCSEFFEEDQISEHFETLSKEYDIYWEEVE